MFLSLFSPKLIPWDLVVRVALEGGLRRRYAGGEDEEEEEKQLAWTEAELNEAKKQLYKRNLIQQVEEREGCYKVHSLVRWFLQDKLAEFDPPQPPLERDLRRIFATAMIKIA